MKTIRFRRPCFIGGVLRAPNTTLEVPDDFPMSKIETNPPFVLVGDTRFPLNNAKYATSVGLVPDALGRIQELVPQPLAEPVLEPVPVAPKQAPEPPPSKKQVI